MDQTSLVLELKAVYQALVVRDGQILTLLRQVRTLEADLKVSGARHVRRREEEEVLEVDSGTLRRDVFGSGGGNAETTSRRSRTAAAGSGANRVSVLGELHPNVHIQEPVGQERDERENYAPTHLSVSAASYARRRLARAQPPSLKSTPPPPPPYTPPPLTPKVQAKERTPLVRRTTASIPSTAKEFVVLRPVGSGVDMRYQQPHRSIPAREAPVPVVGEPPAHPPPPRTGVQLRTPRGRRVVVDARGG